VLCSSIFQWIVSTKLLTNKCIETEQICLVLISAVQSVYVGQANSYAAFVIIDDIILASDIIT